MHAGGYTRQRQKEVAQQHVPPTEPLNILSMHLSLSLLRVQSKLKKSFCLFKQHNIMNNKKTNRRRTEWDRSCNHTHTHQLITVSHFSFTSLICLFYHHFTVPCPCPSFAPFCQPSFFHASFPPLSPHPSHKIMMPRFSILSIWLGYT